MQRSMCVAIAALLVSLASCSAQDGAARTSPHRVFASSRFLIDEILKRPYSPDVPMGCVGKRLWASSPQGWGFGSDVHWMYLSNLKVFDIEIRDEHGLLVPDKATYYPSHIRYEGAKRVEMIARASYTAARDDPQNPLSKPFDPEKRWTCWGSGKREDWYEIQFGSPRKISGLKLWFFDDAATGGECRPPDGVKVQTWDGAWKDVRSLTLTPRRPSTGMNELLFEPANTDRVRLVFRNAGERSYTGLYGIETIVSNVFRPPPIPWRMEADKFISQSDELVCLLNIANVRPAGGHVSTKERVEFAFALHPAIGSHLAFVRTSSASWQFSGRLALSGINASLEGVASASSEGVLRLGERSPSLTMYLGPGESGTVALTFAIRPEGAEESLAQGPVKGSSRQVRQVRTYQSWYDDNLADFACSDPWIEKMYYHRAYVLRKNLMEPGIGRMKWPCFSEGRWRSGWYPNVISYGAGHQIREARWLRDPKYWMGHLRTFAYNQKPDGVYPNFVRPNEIGKGQYTDWITSTAWDGYLVHPKKQLLEQLADLMANNVRGWQKVYDPDGDGLLRVDSHWWTGMEWQPSFFYFSDYKRSENGSEPANRVEIDRVDLTSYQYGNARAVANVYREIGKPEKAGEFEALATKIENAMAAKMWDASDEWLYSLKAFDGAKAKVKEVVGVYPSYFGMPAALERFGAAWSSLTDPKQFWTAWPVASASKECPAYSQSGWPGGGVGGCMWNGPTWPHANSLVISGMANAIRASRTANRQSRIAGDRLWDLLASYTRAQFQDGKLENPWTGEFYDGETGKWKTAERDYFHSTYLDLVMTCLVGIVPRNDDVLEVDPLVPEGKLSYFILDGQHYRGHDVTVVWDAPDGKDSFSDGRKGLDVYVDGKLRASRKGLGRTMVRMK